MTILQAIILGIIQGITEFLPISSSGHLVVAPAIFGWALPKDEAFFFDVLVQIGTLVAVFIYFWDDILTIIQTTWAGLRHPKIFTEKPESRLGLYLLLSALPAGIIGLLFKDTIESVFDNPQATAGFLLFTAALLVAAERFENRSRKLEDVNWIDTIWIGFFQVLALFPGVSRSGTTITGGMARGLDRPSAARFSFLMSIPIMGATGVYTLFSLQGVPNRETFFLPMAVGFVTSAVVGYIAIRWLLQYLTSNRLYVFSIYLVILSILVLAIS